MAQYHHSLQELIIFLKSDLYRYGKTFSTSVFLISFVSNSGYNYTCLMRICNYLYGKNYLLLFCLVARFFLRHCRFRYGISIPFSTQIGRGFFISHPGDIVVNSATKIGHNCNISQGVTIGISVRGKHKGTPTIGNNVYIGPGAKIIGNIVIGNNVAIGANAVVVDDVPDNAVVAGVPAKIVTMNGAGEYINNPWV